jgi:hypothetical protein
MVNYPVFKHFTLIWDPVTLNLCFSLCMSVHFAILARSQWKSLPCPALCLRTTEVKLRQFSWKSILGVSLKFVRTSQFRLKSGNNTGHFTCISSESAKCSSERKKISNKNCDKVKKKVKLSLYNTVEAHRVVRCRGSHILSSQSTHRWRWGCQPYTPAGRAVYDNSSNRIHLPPHTQKTSGHWPCKLCQYAWTDSPLHPPPLPPPRRVMELYVERVYSSCFLSGKSRVHNSVQRPTILS